jgi:hypothetical protein
MQISSNPRHDRPLKLPPKRVTTGKGYLRRVPLRIELNKNDCNRTGNVQGLGGRLGSKHGYCSSARHLRHDGLQSIRVAGSARLTTPPAILILVPAASVRLPQQGRDQITEVAA